MAFSVVYNIPRYFEMVTKEDPQSKLLRIESTKMRQNPIYISLYVFWSKLILVREIKEDYIFFNFPCMFLNSKKIFQFEFELF